MMETLIRLSGGAPAAALLLVSLLVIGGIGLFAAPQIIVRNLLRPHGLVQRREFATLVTSGFVHADLPHLAFNCFTFWAFGFGLERQIGTPAFALLYATGLLASSLATWALHRRQPGYASLGASGAILAVLFASIVVFPKASIYILPIPVPIPAPWFALGYLAYSVFAGRAHIGRVNHDAHVAGAVAGVLFMAWIAPGSVARAVQAVVG